MYGTISYTTELVNKVNAIRQAIHQTPAATPEIMKEAERINDELDNIMFIFNGPKQRQARKKFLLWTCLLHKDLRKWLQPVMEQAGDISVIGKEQLEILKVEFPPVLARIKKAGEDLQKLDKQLDAVKAPWTPGRVPVL